MILDLFLIVRMQGIFWGESIGPKYLSMEIFLFEVFGQDRGGLSLV